MTGCVTPSTATLNTSGSTGPTTLAGSRCPPPSRGGQSPYTIRAWMYHAIIPCLHSECPHGKEPETCEYIDHDKISSCPSSRSPHQVRTGVITWMRHQGVSVDVVAERVNSSLRTIKLHCDKPDMREEMEKRRRPYLDRLSLDETDEEDDDQDGEPAAERGADQ